MEKKKLACAIATAAAVAFTTLPLMSTTAFAATHEVKCFGVNTCKGQSACKSAQSTCKGHNTCKTAKSGCNGQNSCKGKGFLMKTPATCKKEGGSLTAPAG